MKKNWFVSLLICLLMICFMSVTAFATEPNYVAEVNDQQYETLQGALNAAKDGATVKLLDDVNTTGNTFIQKNITLDLDGHTITSSGQSALCIYYSGEEKVTVTVKNGVLTGGTAYTVWGYNAADLTLEDVTVTATGDCAVVQNAGTLTLNSCSVDGGEGGGIWDFGTKSTVTLNDSEVTGGYFGVYHNGSTAGFTLTANNSTITGNSDTACAIYVSGSSKNTAEDQDGMNSITLTGCTVTGPTGIEGKYTNMALTECDITATATASYEQNNNGSTALGFAVVSTDNSVNQTTPTPIGEITINGGSYTGLVGLSQCSDVTEGFSDYTETASYAVTGGTFSGDVSAYLAEDVENVEYNTVLKAPTCTTNGIGKLIQIVDGETSTSYYVIPSAHKAAEAVKENEVEASCTESGSYDSVVYCSVCNEELSRETVTVEAKGHTAPETGVTTVEATCAKDGSRTYTCTVCDEEITEVIPATGEHTWIDSEYIAATCTENGKAGGQVCQVCGAENPENPPEDLGTVDPAKGHTWVLDDTAEGYKAATCVEDGMGTYKCSAEGCDATKIEVIPATGEHTEVVVDDKEPTCGEAGYTEGVKCSVCGAVLYGMEEIPATGEHAEEVVSGKAATCKEAGLTDGKRCSTCGKILVEQEEIPVDPDAHEYVETVLKDPTCTANGVGKYVCSECGASKYATIPADHSWNEGEVTTAATCTEAGMKTYTCNVEGCGATKTEEIPALGHAYDEGKVTTAATCGKDGVMTYTCSVCNETKTEVIPATGEHNYEESVKDATCTEPALVGEICSVCGQAKSELTAVGEPDGHKYVEKVTKEATCVEAGEKTYTCSVCEDSYTEVIPATGEHTDQFVEAKAPTCVEDGYTEGVKCSVCGEVLYGCENIPATGEHTEEIVPGKAATCKETGLTEGKKCSVCNEILVAQEEIPVVPDAHEYVETILKPATCTTTGIGKYVCATCGDYYYATIEASHTWNDGEVIKAATCGEAGVMTYTCTVEGCNATKTEEIPATGEHNYVEDVVEATCTENAKVGFVCSECGAVDPGRETVEVPDSMIDHEYEEVVVAATCTENGSVTKTCKNCGDEVIEVLLATGHTRGESEYINATCSENGKEVVKCSVCNEILEENDMGDLDPATGHTEEEIPAVPATCGAVGSTAGTKCSVCGEILTAPEEIPINETAHQYEVTALKSATCSTTGIGKYVCSICGDSYYGVIKTIPHTFSEESAEITTEPTCTEAGVLTVTCSECGETDERAIDALGHNWGAEQASEDGTYVYKACSRCDEIEIIAWLACEHENTEIKNATEATCTTAGYTGDTVCTDCGETIEKGEEIAALDHTEEVIKGKAATCTETGLTEGKKCSVCGETLVEQEEIPAAGHTPAEAVKENEVPATETENGSYDSVVYCSVCGAELSRETIVIPATGPAGCEHENTEIQNAKAATCTEEGYTGDTICTDCGETIEEGEVIAALGHTEEVVGAKAATCTEAGYTGDTVCSVCGEIIQAGEEIAAKGHTIVTDLAVEATCGTSGLTEGSHCSECGEVIVAQEVIPATGKHDYETVVNEDGSVTYTCKICGDSFTEMP